jgi:hypothetical protein
MPRSWVYGLTFHPSLVQGSDLHLVGEHLRVRPRQTRTNCCGNRCHAQIVPPMGLSACPGTLTPALSRREREKSRSGIALPSPSGRGIEGEGIRAAILPSQRILQQFPQVCPLRTFLSRPFESEFVSRAAHGMQITASPHESVLPCCLSSMREVPEAETYP